jgi:rubrerythrin
MNRSTTAALIITAITFTSLSATTYQDTPPTQVIQHDQAKTDLKIALDTALNDERKAKAFYKAVMSKFGERRPFSNIVHAEQRHENALLAQYERLNLPVPEDRWETHTFEVPDSFQETADASIVAEIENVAIYDRIDSMVTDEQVLAVFKNLRWASQERHLRAFTRHGSGWHTITQAQLNTNQQTQLDRATKAQQAFFGALIQELTTALNEGGPTQAIAVCSTRAPEIASTISDEHDLQIGRTSDKLRNPNNTKPLWARMISEPNPNERLLMTNTAGNLAVLSPIKLSETCLQCHGSETDIAPKTRASLQKIYPNDQATGYQSGDHRGWFVIEVPRN